MSGAGIALNGFDQVVERLKKTQENLDKKVHIIALDIEREAKRIVPVRTGRLRASIHTGQIKTAAYYVGTNVEYAPYVEFGTRKMRARPYLRPAAKKVLSRIKAQGIRWWME